MYQRSEYSHRRLAVVALMVGAGSVSAWQSARAGDPPKLTLSTGGFEVFHDSDRSPCGSTEVHIDSPVRAFKDQYGLVHMTTADPRGRAWQWTGSVAQFTSSQKEEQRAALDCTPVLEGNSGNNQMKWFDQKTFLQGFYFDSAGGYVYGYGHEDYFGTRLNDPDCHDGGTADGKPTCWYSAIALWKADALNTSPVGHLNFAKSNGVPWHIAIYPHVTYPGDAATPLTGWIGYGTPSNLVRGRNADGSPDGYTYMFAFASTSHGGQDKGVCLFRSDDPSVRASWRAWDDNASSSGFTQAMQNPYISTSSTAPCAVVNPGEFDTPLRSVHWHAPSKHFIGIFRAKAPSSDGSRLVSVRYATSPDLIHWSPSASLFVGAADGVIYPAILDFDSASDLGGSAGDYNFDTIYDQGKIYLYYRTSVASGHTQIKRRLLEVSNY